MRDKPVPGFRITEITAFTSIGPDDEEGVIGFKDGDSWFPMVAADIARLAHLRMIADHFRADGMVITERVFKAVDCG